jgi:hypothetical protein
VTKKLSNHPDGAFEKQVSIKVIKKVNNIMGDTKLEKKFVSIYVDDEFNERILKEAMK